MLLSSGALLASFDLRKLDPRQRLFTSASYQSMILTYSYNTAYWIAFGPYGPRAVDDPAENWNVFKLTMTIVGISTVVFFIIQAFARPAPKTMNAQYQQMTNEYLKVRQFLQALQRHSSACLNLYRTNNLVPPETKSGAHHGSIVRRLQGQRDGSEQAKKRGHSVRRRRRIIGNRIVARVFYPQYFESRPMSIRVQCVLLYELRVERLRSEVGDLGLAFCSYSATCTDT